jgi:hypothetical protein
MIKLLIALSVFITSEIHAQQSFNKLNVKELDVTSRVNVISTTKSSKPCPAMTETQRDLIASPATGSCIYNTTALQLNIYDGTAWQSAGGGGIENWQTAISYDIDDVVIESNKIYQCETAHTSGTFATDLAALKWVELSAQQPVNLTGPITSIGAATSITSQTGTGSTFVVQNTPTLTTPNIGAATGTSLTLAGNISAYNYDKDNLLVNGNIENPLSTEWTCTVGTCTRTTTSGEFSKDTAALKVALSAQAMNVSQTVTTPSGIQKQGFARAIYRVPATMADFQICTLVDAAEQTCVPTANLIKDDTFRSIEIPLTFGTTSAGIKFKTTSSYTANAYFDGAIVAQGLGLQNLSVDTNWIPYVPTFTGFGTVSTTECAYRINAPDMLIRCRFVSGTSTATEARVSLPSGYTSASVTDIPTIQVAGNYYKNNSNVNIFATVLIEPSVSYMTFSGLIVTNALDPMTKANGSSIAASGEKEMLWARIPLANLSAASNVYSQASANYDWTSYSPAILGWGTIASPASNYCKHKRENGDLLVSCAFTGGTAQPTIGTIPLPATLQIDSSRIVASNTTGVAGQKVGSYGSNTAQANGAVITATGTSLTNVYTGSTNNNSSYLIPTTVNAIIGNSALMSIEFRVPIVGWSNSNQIVGSFENVPTVPGAGARIDKGVISYGATSSTQCTTTNTNCAYLDQIGTMFNSTSGVFHGASTGRYTLNFNRTYIKIKCQASPSSTGTGGLSAFTLTPSWCANCSSLQMDTGNTAAYFDSMGSVECMGSY